MILRGVENIIEEEKREGEFIYPFYRKYCFSNIPSTILESFNIQIERPRLPSKLYENIVELQDTDKIVLLLVDGFGYNQCG